MRALIAAEVVVALAASASPTAEHLSGTVAMELERDPNAKAPSAAPALDSDALGSRALTRELQGALAQATSGFAAFEATVAGLGAFPTPTRPRVIWAGVGRGADALVGLAGRVDEALAALGFEREPRPFSPHATLGRVRTPRRDPALADALLAAEGREFGRLSVERVALMRSDLSSRGARYTELAAVRLA